jgi:8-oxo-dGTP pyrophosphatase MutT (NUDIX family)/GNAT superfamily N-acetyltransferase
MSLPDAIVAVVLSGPFVLMIRRGPDGPDPGYWAPPSGKIEPGEGQEAAVIREVKEEVGVTIRPVRKIWESVSAGGTHTLHWWLADAEDPELRPDWREVSEARWVAVSEIATLQPTFPGDRYFFEEILTVMSSGPARDIQVASASRVDDELIAAFNRLIPQLSRSAVVPTPDLIREIVDAPATRVLVARDGRDNGRIVGLLTLVVFRIPTGVRAWIEDVVVDEAVRGRGVGEALSQEAIRQAVGSGARTVELTSRPSREAANRLYQRLGFVRRDSNVYRYTP